MYQSSDIAYSKPVRYVAKQNLQHAHTRMKVWYDKRSRERSFKPRDKVLALLPLPGHSLQARYHGPYVVERKVSSVDYVIVTPDCRKQRQFCHINMLKDYHEQNCDGEKTCAVASIPNVVCEKVMLRKETRWKQTIYVTLE